MISISEIKFLRSLKEKKFRDAEGLFIVEGEKMVAEALDSDFKVEAVWRAEDIGEDAMRKISLLSTPSPALALVRRKETAPVECFDGVSLALDGVRDPGNMGTIIRLAEWFGVTAVHASPDCVEFFNPKVIQSSMGSIFRVSLNTTPLPALCRRFREKGAPVCGTFMDGEDIYSAALPENALVIMGNEANGITAAVAAETDLRIHIPSFGATAPESLNVAVASAVCLSEFKRQNSYKKI